MRRAWPEVDGHGGKRARDYGYGDGGGPPRGPRDGGGPPRGPRDGRGVHDEPPRRERPGGGSKGGGGGKGGGKGGGGLAFRSGSDVVGRGGDANALANVDTPVDTVLVVDPVVESGGAIATALRRLAEEARGQPRALRALQLEVRLPSGACGASAATALASRDAEAHDRWCALALMPFVKSESWSGLHCVWLNGVPLASSGSLAPIGGLTRLRELRVEYAPLLPTDAACELQQLSRLELLSFNGPLT
jgi:hypothetical protein